MRRGPFRHRSHISRSSTHTESAAFLRALQGLRAGQVMGLRATPAHLRGKPKSNLDWSTPASG